MAKSRLYNLKQGQPNNRAVQVCSADGAITIRDGIVRITKGSAAALTLAAPVANKDDGVRLVIHSTTAYAHTVTVSGGIAGAGTSADVGTFGGAANDGVELYAYGGYWHVVPGTNLNVTFA